MIYDTFMVNDEFDILEMRLMELEPIGDLIHVAVEADVDHQDHSKPYHLSENLERFAPWKDRLRVVRATGLPTAADDPDPWARELAQREYVREAMTDAAGDDIVLHGDLDEIPTVLAARNVRPRGFVSFAQRGHFWSVRWLYPHPWHGTVAARVAHVSSFGAMRGTRNMNTVKIPNAGWHFSWLPKNDLDSMETAYQKVGSFCHPEVLGDIERGLRDGNRFLREGVHVDGARMDRVDIDASFPRYIREGRCPESWLQ